MKPQLRCSLPFLLALLTSSLHFSRGFVVPTAGCDWPTISAADLTLDEFQDTYHLKQPLKILLDKTVHSKVVAAWSINKVIARFGGLKLSSGSLGELQYGGPPGVTGVERTIRDALNPHASDITTARYMFHLGDRMGMPEKLLKALYKDLDLLGLPHFAHARDGYSGMPVFSAGVRDDGIPLHLHGDAWLNVVDGLKYWGVFAPGTLSEVGFDLGSFREWLNVNGETVLRGGKMRGNKEVKMLGCVQESGTIVYVPEGWYHGVLNLRPTLAIGAQFPPTEKAWFDFACEVDEESYMADLEERFKRIQDFEMAVCLAKLALHHWNRIRAKPANKEHKMRSKVYRTKLGHYIKRALNLNPVSARAHALRARALATLRPTGWHKKAVLSLQQALKIDPQGVTVEYERFDANMLESARIQPGNVEL